ncbi:MAG: hypothetical protein ACKVZH_03965 [Blastocatellia bacterium]
MSKRLTDRETLFHKLQQMTDLELEDVLNYVSLLERSKHRNTGRGVTGMKDSNIFQHTSATSNSPNSEDELLALLSSAYENRRACQVFEWEAARRKSEIKVRSYVR